MREITGVGRMRCWSRQARARGKTIALVPTMGFLHEGHLSLVRRARKQSDAVVMSIFVNPLQFGPKEDFKVYPRDLKRDRELARREGCDVLFVPPSRQVYPKGFLTRVHVEGLQEGLCGASRPGHFTGVCTVVLKLVNMVEPHVVLFGQKDAQQAVILRRMLRDLNVDVKVVVCPTLRERDGLAMSSRNRYLSDVERKKALAISRSLFAARELVRGGERRAGRIKRKMKETLSRGGITRVEYVAVMDARELVPLSVVRGEVLIAVAARVGKARLIDNLKVRV
ncbi:MAG: pantoate--beta-alanine ligase [Candidatus Eiseniibacteriota bacterium]|nr:MAG: pantoate--beta-alanine ligase [Candidatus Eisenbacteria bacterium]